MSRRARIDPDVARSHTLVNGNQGARAARRGVTARKEGDRGKIGMQYAALDAVTKKKRNPRWPDSCRTYLYSPWKSGRVDSFRQFLRDIMSNPRILKRFHFSKRTFDDIFDIKDLSPWSLEFSRRLVSYYDPLEDNAQMDEDAYFMILDKVVYEDWKTWMQGKKTREQALYRAVWKFDVMIDAWHKGDDLRDEDPEFNFDGPNFLNQDISLYDEESSSSASSRPRVELRNRRDEDSSSSTSTRSRVDRSNRRVRTEHFQPHNEDWGEEYREMFMACELDCENPEHVGFFHNWQPVGNATHPEFGVVQIQWQPVTNKFRYVRTKQCEEKRVISKNNRLVNNALRSASRQNVKIAGLMRARDLRELKNQDIIHPDKVPT